MESGLKRLWIRRRSKGPEAQHGLDVKGLRRVQSTDLKGLSAQRSNRAIKTSMGNAPSQLTPVSSGDNTLRPPSNRRVQPTLLGVSRPSTSPSRPGTSGSGSLLSAVNRAADAVTTAEQEYLQSAETYTKTHTGVKAPRYVDIFALSKPGNPHGYNEDVAERNLDLVRVALDGSQSPHSLSKYQEDVATRNAYPPLSPPVPKQASPSSARYYHNNESLQNGIRPMTSTLSSRPLLNMETYDRLASSDLQHQIFAKSHSRHRSDHSWDSQSPGSALQPARGNAGPASMGSSYNTGSDAPSTSQAFPSTAYSSVLPQPQLNGTQVAQSASLDGFRGENLRNYVLSQSELIHARTSDRPQILQSHIARSVDGRDGTQPSDREVRSPSALSNTSSVKRSINLPHRTIMDLTGEDSEVFSEVSPDSQYSVSPVVESAKSDALRRMHLSGTSPMSKSNTNHPSDVRDSRAASQDAEKLPISLSTNPGATSTHESTKSATSAAQLTKTKAVSGSAFSPINTIVDFEPRKSVIVEARSATLVPDMAPPQPESRTDISSPAIQPVIAKKENPQKVPVGTDYHAPEVRHPKTTESTPVSAQGFSQEQGPTSMKRSLGKEVTESPAVAQELQSPVSETSDLTTPQSQPNIHMTPDSLHSIDFVDPSRAFGVTTRDFAATPSKVALASVPEDTEPSANNKSRHPGYLSTERRTVSHDSGASKYSAKSSKSTARYTSTFDEDEFAQKQADARAALVRLQQSLDENFLTHPPPAPTAEPARVLRHHSSLSDGKPVAPSSIFAKVGNSSPTPADYRLSVATSNSSEGGRPQISYHNLTTVAPPNGQPQPQQWGSSATTVEQLAQSSKGKQKFDAGLNGPGPSISDEVHQEKQAFPLPPPLHLNGYVLYRNLHQAPVPPSPGEISLSSFPIPVSSPRQSFRSGPDSPDVVFPQSTQHSHQNSAGTGRGLRRQSSQRSQASSASAFSIPYHMIPDRSSSARDRMLNHDHE